MKLLIRHARIAYAADVIIESADFEVHDREKIALVGRNGCGKTTLLKYIAGDIQADNLDSDEEFVFSKAGGLSIGYLRQINFEDPNVRCGDEIRKVFADLYRCRDKLAEVEEALAAEPSDKLLKEYDRLQARIVAMGGDSAEREMNIVFQKFGFEMADLDKPIGNFSGGQQTKIAFIKLLLEKPDILLLDEPTNHLDMPTIEWLEGYLKNYPSAVVIVSHDREFLDDIVSVTYEIEYGRVKRYSGNYTAFTLQKQADYEKQLKDYEAQQKEIKRLQDWVDMWKNTPTKVTAARSKLKAIEHMEKIEKPRRFDTISFRAFFSPRIESYTDVLCIKDLTIGYDRPLSTVNMKLRKKERLAIIGENGMGKSTLLKTVMGMIPALGGNYEVGKNVEIGYFDQQQAVKGFDDNIYDNEQTVIDNFWDEYPRLTRTEVQNALAAFMFTQEEVDKKLGMLSGGERVRLALCKMFFTRPNLLILDEPTNHMDMLGKESLENMLANYEGTVLFVSHDRYFIRQVATGILEFKKGEVTQYNYNYEGYLEEVRRLELRQAQQEAETLQETTAQAAAKPQAANPGKLRSKLEHRLEKLEELLAESEKNTAIYDSQLADEGVSSDYKKVSELMEMLEDESIKQEEYLNEMMQIEEDLKELQ